MLPAGCTSSSAGEVLREFVERARERGEPGAATLSEQNVSRHTHKTQTARDVQAHRSGHRREQPAPRSSVLPLKPAAERLRRVRQNALLRRKAFSP